MQLFLLLLGKLIIFGSKLFNLGSGSTWPGHIALSINPDFNKRLLEKSSVKTVIIAGTNGKTTTGRLIRTILEGNSEKVIQNEEGANLLNGLSSTLIKGSDLSGKLNYDYLIFESDENTLPLLLSSIKTDYLICLDLFRDQLDRYGEIDTISKKWTQAFSKLSTNTTVILNADDPQVAYLGKSLKAKTLYFGLESRKSPEEVFVKHGADAIYCPNCLHRLTFSSVSFSHLGNWACENCGFKRPKPNLSSIPFYPLIGTYNKYNSIAAFLFASTLGISANRIIKTLKTFTPAFGRQEKLSYKGRAIQIFLSKNPTSFNESLATVKEVGGKNLLIVLNDRIPDGLDVSWIWDINFEEILKDKAQEITLSGDRVYDMALRLKYADKNTEDFADLEKAIDGAIKKTPKKDTLYVLPNYSAMLDLRKILTGKKI